MHQPLLPDFPNRVAVLRKVPSSRACADIKPVPFAVFTVRDVQIFSLVTHCLDRFSRRSEKLDRVVLSTPIYKAAEVILGMPRSYPLDIWGFGIGT